MVNRKQSKPPTPVDHRSEQAPGPKESTVGPIGGHPLSTTKQYVIGVPGAVPADLSAQISSLHASAILSRRAQDSEHGA